MRIANKVEDSEIRNQSTWAGAGGVKNRYYNRYYMHDYIFRLYIIYILLCALYLTTLLYAGGVLSGM